MTTPTFSSPSTANSAPTFLHSAWLVAVREIVMKLRSKAFLISTGILMLAVLGSVLAGGIISGSPSKRLYCPTPPRRSASRSSRRSRHAS